MLSLHRRRVYQPLSIEETQQPQQHLCVHQPSLSTASWWESTTYKSIRNWSLYYAVTLVFSVLLCGSATMLSVMMKFAAKLGLICSCVDLLKGHRPALYGLLLSIWLFRFTPSFAGMFHLVKPCHEFQQMIHEMQFEQKPFDILGARTIGGRKFQALGLGNGYMKELAEALQVHYERDDVEHFYYVKDLTLIANEFDEQGLDYVLQALEHPKSYTTQLLLGRNPHLGDKAAEILAQFVEKPSSVVFVEFGSTRVTPLGLRRLYEAARSRPLEYLGLEYTDGWFELNPPIPRSLVHLSKATRLQEISFTGNTLSDADMPELVNSILQTNVTKLGLTNNRIGSKGVKALLPLVSRLKSLELGINWRIGDEGAIELAKALKDPNATIEELSLFSCGVGQKGAEALLGIFPENKRLKYVSVALREESNSIRKETLVALRNATRANGGG